MWPMLLMLGGSMLSSGGSAFAAAQTVKQGRYAREVNQYAADYAKTRGEFEATKLRRVGEQVISAQRAATAAAGFQPDTGTALELQVESQILNDMDIAMVRQAGSMEAVQFEVMGRQQMAGAYGGASALYASGSKSLLSGAMAMSGGSPFQSTSGVRNWRQERTLTIPAG